MEYSPASKINKSPKERQALIDAPPPIGARSLYAKTYAKHGKTIGQSKDAMNKAYEAVEKKHGKDMRDKLSAFHNENEASAKRGENYPMKRGGSAKKSHANW
jgi:hypothetical protein